MKCRFAEFPNVAIRPELRYLPPGVQHPHEWRLSRTASMSQLPPVADIYALQRQGSNIPHPMRLREPSKYLPPILGSPAIRRKSVKRHIPGSYVLERNLTGSERYSGADAHQYRAYQPTSMYSLYPRSSNRKQRPRQKQRAIQRANTKARETRPKSTLLMKAVRVKYVNGGPLRRLSLGDISGWVGRLWDV
jgi:hypothetical protein